MIADETSRSYLPPKIINKMVNFLGKDDIMFILLCGSHLTETEDEDSDRDFIAVSKHRKNMDYCQLMFQLPNNTPEHCTMFVNSVTDYTNPEINSYVNPIALHFYKANRNELVYENPLYKEEIDELFNNRAEISKRAAISALLKQEPLVDSLLKKYTYEKWHYHLYFAYELLSGEYIPRELLKDMKRGRAPTTCIEYLKKIKDWIKNNKDKYLELKI